MIYTLTLNPSIDIYSDFTSFEIGKINSTTNQKFLIGGKGINVSFMLEKFKVENVPIIVVGGFLGQYIQKELAYHFKTLVFWEKKTTRVCYKMLGLEETSINPKPEPLCLCKNHLKEALQELTKEDYLIVSGSGILSDYQEILKGVQAHLIFDLSGKNLLGLLDLNPLLVKPNDEELQEISSQKEDAYQILLKHASMVLHTQGAHGATLVTKDIQLHQDVAGTDIISTVGCGDAFLAGFIKGHLVDQLPLEEALKLGSECAYFHGKTMIQ